MTSRRAFVAATGAAFALRPPAVGVPWPLAPGPSPAFEPWLEVDAAAIRHNVEAVSRLAGGRPIVAVVKNNSYGLGLEVAGPIVDRLPQVHSLAVVRASEALALRRAGAKKPILLMNRATDEEAVALASQGVRLGIYGDDAPEQVRRVAKKLGRPVAAHLYMDTGMNRMGQRVDRSAGWVAALAAGKSLRVEGTFTELTEERDFDPVQVERLRTFAGEARSAGLEPGPLHAASSLEVFHLPGTHLDMVRPGFALWGGYVSDEARAAGGLSPAFALKAPVIRVEFLNAGDGVSYFRPWKAERPTWIAVLAIGHADGYPRTAVKGAEALIGGRLFKVVGAVSASHTILELGSEPAVRVGDVATLIGPGHDAIHPNEVAFRSGTSAYDRFMHLGAGLRRVLQSAVSSQQ
jgi:alanine racemase